jgi:hypothetical protein
MKTIHECDLEINPTIIFKGCGLYKLADKA